MDPLTHAASGAVAMLALPQRPATRIALPLAALAATAPDADVFLASGPLQFLLLHRGITHSLAALPLLGLMLACLARPLWSGQTPGHWRFVRVWLFMSAMAALHVWLDVVTTYGTMIFLPFSCDRVRLNSVFIIDPLLTLPLVWAALRWRLLRGRILFVLGWLLVYPALGTGLNALHTATTQERLVAEGRMAAQITVLLDALAPLFWRALFVEKTPRGRLVFEQSLNVLGRPRGPEIAHKAAPEDIVRRLASVSTVCGAFFDFAILPVIVPLRPQDAQTPGGRAYLLHDLRFGSGLAFARARMAMRPKADIPFQLLVELVGDGQNSADASSGHIWTAGTRLASERLRFADSGRDSGWQAPRVPGQASFAAWLVGLR